MKVPDMHRSRWKDGDWTDDTDQMILIMISLIENNGKVSDPFDTTNIRLGFYLIDLKPSSLRGEKKQDSRSDDDVH